MIYTQYIYQVLATNVARQQIVTNDGRTSKDSSKQYGTGGKLQGKKYMLSLTWNAPKEAFDNKNQFLLEGKTVDDVFINNTAVYKFCGVEILPSFSCFDVIKNPSINEDIKRLKAHLKNVINF